MFIPQEVIIKKRNKKTLTDKDINNFVTGITSGGVSDAQIAAFTMGVFLNGMDKKETVALTMAMANSGNVLKWSLNGPVVDKHSTGGVGDKVSLMLAPMLAGCGCYIPMISGRGLGHTGGTLDKLESIKGYNVFLDSKKFEKVVKDVGCSIIGQTKGLAPADGKIYAIRDIAGTVESLPLITASILSKKLAAGLDTLVMDIKVGNGAFMQNMKDAKALGNSIVGVANGAGVKTRAIITDMNQVLGNSVGNALEVVEVIKYLQGTYRDKRLHSVVMGLCAEILMIEKIVKNKEEAYTKLQKVLDSGKALEIFEKMVVVHGGAKDFIKNYEKSLPKAKIIKPVYAQKSGYVTAMDTREIGISIIKLKGGRVNASDKLDLSIGYSDFCQIGDFIDKKTPLAMVYCQSDTDFKMVEKVLRDSVVIKAKKPKNSKILYEIIKNKKSRDR